MNEIDDEISKILWIKRFLEYQGFQVKLNITHQANAVIIKLAENRKASSGKSTRHFDIRLFYITNLTSRDEIKVKCCTTDQMIGDYMTKLLLGKQFKRLISKIINIPYSEDLVV